MLPLTTIGVLKVMPRAMNVVASFIGPLNQAMVKGDIHTNPRIAAFLAHSAHESGELTRLEENLNYSARALVATWPKRITAEIAAELERKPEAIANHVFYVPAAPELLLPIVEVIPLQLFAYHVAISWAAIVISRFLG